MQAQVVKTAASAVREINAVVVSSGLMLKTVKVAVGKQKWDNHIRKQFNQTKHILVHDPASSLRTGDVVSISSGWRTSKNVNHVVNKILAPFGEPIETRPPVPTEQERIAARIAKKNAKEERKRIREGGAPVVEPPQRTPEEMEVLREERRAARRARKEAALLKKEKEAAAKIEATIARNLKGKARRERESRAEEIEPAATV
ncbi:hypothetical protein BJ875DRAFT_380885 [Amylocarpus encephaloides]|uniref:Ribosomal protein S17 n=1 Tax=Amylocarpus encephaloides TaxID=45428 RepID=A0A9P7YFY7_9HELO|nr:hypothetical protein BJ875DRAFT_380885 [Amylocarpus encephaloides]